VGCGGAGVRFRVECERSARLSTAHRPVDALPLPTEDWHPLKTGFYRATHRDLVFIAHKQL
jgi:hypothetical protein